MSTKKQLQKEAAEKEAVVVQGEKTVRWVYLAVCLLVIVAFIIAVNSAIFLARNASNSKDISTSLESYQPWPESIVEEFQKLRIQNGGRVKPAHTYARFGLIQMNNSSKVKFETQDGEKHKITAEEWMLDAFFRPDLAKDLPVFNVDDTDVVIALGVPAKDGGEQHRKRDRYSYNQLAVARMKLAVEENRLREEKQKDPDYRFTRMERMTQRLASNVAFFEAVSGQFLFASKGDGLEGNQLLPPDALALTKQYDAIGFLRDAMPQTTMQQLMGQIQQPVGDSVDARAIHSAFLLYYYYATAGSKIPFLTPDDPLKEEWTTAGNLLIEGMEQEKSERTRVVSRLQEIADIYEAQKTMWQNYSVLPEDAPKDEIEEVAKPVAEKIAAFVDSQREGAKVRYEALLAQKDAEIAATDDALEKRRLQEKKDRIQLEDKPVEREVDYYEANYFQRSLGFYVIGFIVLAISWLIPGSKFSKVVGRIAVALTVFGLFYNAYGITLRCIIQSRPPITNLYETVLFITAFAVLLCLLLELMTRRGIATLLAVVIGMGGMFLSMRYEVKEAVDTITPLQAVLDTNYWLTIHVITINIGYAAGLLACFLGITYLYYRFFRPLPKVVSSLTGSKQDDGKIFDEPKEVRDTHRLIAKMTYGIVCFGLFFSIFGTITGGVWANDSWGRFWGWDPKENGALMICLWSLVILHLRMGGYIKDIGVAVNAIILGMIVTFSWWGVNNLGIGLHSYGFTDGVMQALYITWAESLIIICCAIPLWLHERGKRKLKKQQSAERKKAASDSEPPPLPGDAVTS